MDQLKMLSRLVVVLAFVSHFALGGPVNLDMTFNGIGYQRQTFTSDGAFGSSIGLQADGRIVVGGTQLSFNNIGDFAAIRLLINGSLDATFDFDGRVTTSLGPFDQSHSMVIQPDGKIVLGGARYAGDTVNDFAAVRYNTDGTLDNSFDLNGVVATNFEGQSEDHSYGMAMQEDGKLVLVGSTAPLGDSQPADLMLVRYNPDGSLDSSFAGSGKLRISFQGVRESVDSVVIQPDNKILIGGFLFNGFKNDFLTMRLMPNGVPDATYGTGGFVITSINGSNNSISTLALQPDGKILAGGLVTGSSAIVRYNSDGSVDDTFGSNGIAVTAFGVKKLLLNSVGKILAGGNSGARLSALRFLANGAVDPTFNSGLPATATIPNNSCSGSSLAIQNDGKMVVAGTCFNPNSSQNSMVVTRFVESRNAPFDFDGDGNTDPSIFRPGPGEWWWSRSSNGGNGAVQFGSSTDRIVPGDYTGDGKTDIAFWRPSTGFWFILRSDDFSFYAIPFGTGSDIPVPADFDGDGKADAAVFRPSTATWFVNRSGGGTTISQFGLATDLPVAADYDGDGKADIAVYRPTGANGAEWWIAKSGGGTFATQFGLSTDKAVAADYTGDGKADIAFWRPATGEWYILRSEDYSFFAIPFGSSTDIPTPGDYDGDGKTDAAVFRPSNSTWYANRSTGGTLIQQFGSSGDLPLPNAYVR